MNKVTVSIALVALMTFLSAPARAERLMTEEKAIKTMLQNPESVEKVVRPVSAEELEAIKKALGGRFYADSKPGKEPKEMVFHFGLKDGKRTGVAFLGAEPGKWGPVGFAVGMDAETGKIVEMAVVTMSEKRGRPIALRNFLKQFFGKDRSDAFETGKDVNAVAGATISTQAAAFAAKKAVAAYDVLFLKK